MASLTALYFILNFLAATQDVAVDGWALTMLKPSNVGYAATCNSVGQQIGWLMGFVVFTSLGNFYYIDLLYTGLHIYLYISSKEDTLTYIYL